MQNKVIQICCKLQTYSETMQIHIEQDILQTFSKVIMEKREIKQKLRRITFMRINVPKYRQPITGFFAIKWKVVGGQLMPELLII